MKKDQMNWRWPDEGNIAKEICFRNHDFEQTSCQDSEGSEPIPKSHGLFSQT